MSNTDIVRQYYQYFNEQNWAGMLSLVDENIQHYPNQGELREGKAKFAEFLRIMDAHYSETCVDLMLFQGEASERVAAEFFIDGTYKKAQEGLPPAQGQTYHLRVGAFLEVRNGKITRLNNYYNLEDWIAMVSR
ncbi:MAG TPA: nuclear transport factor 2 family protein [Pseudomonadales bacterium]|nr:nuclear transport factor 2 family protein [Pseudomonadales bacterium]